eukprot:c34415_g1_i1 orf=151-408(+)
MLGSLASLIACTATRKYSFSLRRNLSLLVMYIRHPFCDEILVPALRSSFSFDNFWSLIVRVATHPVLCPSFHSAEQEKLIECIDF